MIGALLVIVALVSLYGYLFYKVHRATDWVQFFKMLSFEESSIVAQEMSHYAQKGWFGK